ncbi:helix-turn-helix domain-containing protein [Polaribacter sp. Hel1_85]|uniref:helix-turn-helix domain-containing protein n=1 Tax=Polaribacter sp. Hel1_85 TaxID=1250005 RepID=UPI00055A075B|nr:helix-turn-helix transcriptional regulator [Polaribacter sp. Hel1_85]
MESEKTHFSTIFAIRKRNIKMLKKITIEKLEKKAHKVLKKIVKRRQELGISQTDLAIKLNMTTSGYFKVEKGESKLDLIRLFEIAEFLDIDAKELF